MRMNELLCSGTRPLSLRDTVFHRPLTILVPAPHPDEFDAIGLSLRNLHRQGHALHLAAVKRIRLCRSSSHQSNQIQIAPAI